MADNINNEKLDQYNDSLRESLNLSKMLSDNVVAWAGSMAKVDMEGRSTLSGLKEIGKDIQKTISLTDKLRAGKLKEKEVNLQIGKLQQDYNKYITETQNGINSINSLTQRQVDLQREISNNETKKLLIADATIAIPPTIAIAATPKVRADIAAVEPIASNPA